MPDPFDVVGAAAEPAHADPFDVVAAHAEPVKAPVVQQAAAPKEADPFDIVAQHADKSYPVEQTGNVIPAEQIALQDAGEMAKNVLDNTKGVVKGIPGAPTLYNYAKSPVATIMDWLSAPQRFATGLYVRTKDYMGDDTIMNDLNLDPNKMGLAPEVYPHDVMFRALPSNSKVEKNLRDLGASETQAQLGRMGYSLGKVAVGIGADVIGDPAMWVGGILGHTIKAEEAYKSGQYLEDVVKAAQAGEDIPKLERNLVRIKPPFAPQKLTVEIPLAPLSNAAEKMAVTAGNMIEKVASKVPYGTTAVAKAANGAALAREGLMSLTPYTGILPIDVARAVHASNVEADNAAVLGKLKQLRGDLNLSHSENLLVFNALESTPELNAYEGIEGAKATIEKNAKKMMSETELRPWLLNQINEAAAKKNIVLAPGRAEQLAEGAFRLKQANSEMQIARIKSGASSVYEALDNLRWGYGAHRVDPAAIKALRMTKNPELAEQTIREALQAEAAKVLHEKGPSVIDSAKIARRLDKPVEEANAALKKKLGIEKTFLEDPFASTTIKYAETRRFLRNRDLLNSVAPWAKVPSNLSEEKALLAKGFSKLNVSQFGRTTLEIEQDGKRIATNASEIMLPREAARKLNYDFNKYSGSVLPQLVAKSVDGYYSIFKKFALFRPDYHLENWLDNLKSSVVYGVKNSDYVDAAKVLMGGGGKIGTRTTEDVRAILRDYNVKAGHMFSTEYIPSLDSVLYTGKRIKFEASLNGTSRKAYNTGKFIIGGMNKLGESGENLQRTAFFISRLKRGYSVPMALYETEKVLFNFKRSTAATDWAKRVFMSPFVGTGFKVGFMAPTMIAKAPGITNFYENNLMKVIEAAFNDPVTAWAQHQLFPGYYKMADRIAGPLLPGNHWLAALAGYKGTEEQLPFAVNLGLPGGYGILNQFALWDSQVLKQTVAANPILRSMAIVFMGVDPRTWKDVDINRNAPDLARRMNYAAKQFISGTIAFPGLEKIMNQKLGIGNSEYFDPDAIIALHGGLGKFARVTNFSKEYLFRQIALMQTEKAIRTKLLQTAAQELQGKTVLTAKGKIAESSLGRWYLDKRPYTNADVYNEFQDQLADAQKSQVAAEVLQGKKYTSAELVGMINNVQKTAKETTNAYKLMMNKYLEEMKNKSPEEVDAFIKAADGEIDQMIQPKAQTSGQP